MYSYVNIQNKKQIKLIIYKLIKQKEKKNHGVNFHRAP